jgi:hypothetical protein
MTVRIRYRVENAISSSSAEEKDLGDTKFEVVNDDQGEGGIQRFKLAAGATDTLVCIDNIASVKFLAIRTAPRDPNNALPEVKIRLNSITGEEIRICPLGTLKEANFLITTCGITSLYMTNTSSTVDVDVTLAAAGD